MEERYETERQEWQSEKEVVNQRLAELEAVRSGLLLTAQGPAQQLIGGPCPDGEQIAQQRTNTKLVITKEKQHLFDTLSVVAKERDVARDALRVARTRIDHLTVELAMLRKQTSSPRAARQVSRTWL